MWIWSGFIGRCGYLTKERKLKLDDVLNVIKKTKVVPNFAGFNPANTFEENGVDSLDTYTIILALEEEFGVELEDVELENIDTAEKVFGYISERI